MHLPKQIAAAALLLASTSAQQPADAIIERLARAMRVGVVAASSARLDADDLANAVGRSRHNVRADFLSKSGKVTDEMLEQARGAGIGTLVVLSRFRTGVDRRKLPYYDGKGRATSVDWSSASANVRAQVILTRTGVELAEWTQLACRSSPIAILTRKDDDKQRQGLSKQEAADEVCIDACLQAAARAFEHEALQMLPELESAIGTCSDETLARLAGVAAPHWSFGAAQPWALRGLRDRLRTMTPGAAATPEIRSLVDVLHTSPYRRPDEFEIATCLSLVEGQLHKLKQHQDALADAIHNYSKESSKPDPLDRGYVVLLLHDGDITIPADELDWLWSPGHSYLWSCKPEGLRYQLESFETAARRLRGPHMLLVHIVREGLRAKRVEVLDKVRGDDITAKVLRTYLLRAQHLEQDLRRSRGEE